MGGASELDLLVSKIGSTNNHTIADAQALAGAKKNHAPLSGVGRAVEFTLTAIPKPRLREESDNYPHVVTLLNDNRRVIRCRDGIQWIVQQRIGSRWRSQSYCRSKAGLMGCVGTEISDMALAVLKALPNWIEVQP